MAAQRKQWYSKHYFLHVRYGGPILKHNKADNVRINVLLSPFSVTIPAVEKQKIIKYSEYVVCFLAFVIQHAKRMRRIMLSSVVYPAVPYFSIRYDFRKNVIEHKCFDFLYKVCLNCLQF